MKWQSDEVLAILDACCSQFTFPMLDNGYVYLAASRLSLFRSARDWAMTIEVFGFSPRAGVPDTHIYTFASRLVRARSAADFVSAQAYEAYLANNPNNEYAFVHPIEDGDWMDSENPEVLAQERHTVVVRGTPTDPPDKSEFRAKEVELENPREIQVFEYCRLLAASNRDAILATPEERRNCIPPELDQIMQLEEWNHPDVVNEELPSSNQTFRQLADVLISGDVSRYSPSAAPNTHWKHWPDGGTL